MAEALGLVSSIIAVVGVAGKLGTRALKLKRLWDEVQDVPEQIQLCIEQLEMLAPALQEMESEFQRTRNMVDHDSAGKLSLKYCQKAAASLEGMVQDMQQQIESARKGKRTLARFKVSLKRGIVEEHQKKLQSALQFLSLSQQTYLIALTKMQPSIMISEFRALREEERAEEGRVENVPRIRAVEEHIQSQQLEETQCVNHEVTSTMFNIGGRWTEEKSSFSIRNIPWRSSMFPCALTYQVTEVDTKPDSIAGSDKMRVYQARIQFPLWLLEKSWDFQAFRASHGWTFHLKPWITRPENSQVFEYVRQGRSDLLLQAFEMNDASLYDRHPSGETLLGLAVQSCQPELMSMLSTMGLRIGDVSEATLAEWITESESHLSNRGIMLHLFSIWSKEGGFSCDLEHLSRTNTVTYYQYLLVREAWSIPGFLELVLDTNFPHYDRSIPHSWFSFLPWAFLDPQLLLRIVKRDCRVSPAVFRAQVADKITWVLRSYLHASLENLKYGVEKWRSLVRWMLTGASVSEVTWAEDTVSGSSLLCIALRRIWEYSDVYGIRYRRFTRGISTWLEDLNDVGVDVEEYIQQEIAIGRGVPEFRIEGQSRHPIRFLTFLRPGPSLVLMERGSCPKDWKFEWDPDLETFAGEFWRLVDDPQWPAKVPRLMPGAWLDGSKDDEDDCSKYEMLNWARVPHG